MPAQCRSREHAVLAEFSALEQRRLLRSGQLSARELVQHSLVQAAAVAHLGAFTEVRETLAREAADAADRLLRTTLAAERSTLPPLLGLPTAHKDLVQVEGFTTSHGSAAVPRLRAASDEPVVRAVREAGAICIGKTQVPEFGIAAYSENLVSQPARNPFDSSRTAGGSSGGTAAAIASGVIPAAIASDAGGSIRIPAAACGLLGLKPGRAVVPADRIRGDGELSGVSALAVSGPMARTVEDLALYFDALMLRTRPQRRGSATALAALERLGSVRGLRIGVSVDSPFSSSVDVRFDAAALASLAHAAASLESSGHTVEEAGFSYDGGYFEAFTTVWTRALLRIQAVAEPQLGELARWFLEQARVTGDDRFVWSVDALNSFARSAVAQWGEYDAVLTPTLAFAPPKIGAFQALGAAGDYRLQCEWAPQTSMVNVAGVPAISVPAGVDSTGMPRGVQLIAKQGGEHLLLQLAAQMLG